MPPTIYIKRGLNDALTAVNPVLGSGEMVFVRDTNTIVVGDGSGVYSSLSGIYANPLTHTHTSNDITNWNEAVDDRVSSLLVAGTGINLSYNDSSNTLTVNLASASVPTGVGTSNYVAKWTTANSIGNGIIYDNGSTISIGDTTSLGNKLHISSSNTTSYAYILSNGGIGTQSSLTRINNSSNATNDSFAGLFLTTTRAGTSVSQGAIIANVATSLSTYQPNIVFAARTGGVVYSELMRIDYAGNVGIGASSVSAKLDIRYPAGGGMALIKDSDTNDGLLFGDMAYSVSNAYQGIKHVAMTGTSDYMMMTAGTDNHVSAKAGSDLYLRAGGNSTTSQIRLTASEININDFGANCDFRIEGDSDPNLFFIDASTDRVGIKTPSPDRDFHVNGETHLDGTTVIGTGLPSLGYILTVDGVATIDQLNINGNFTFPTTDGSPDQVLVTNGSGVLTWQDQSGTGTVLNKTVDGRLTLESGEPVSTTDQTAKTTLYFTPYKGNQIALYNGTAWGIHSFSELSLSLSGYTAGTNYDIFVYDNSGTLTLESTAWTDGTTRATALDTQNGVHVKSGATTRRYLGTIRTTATTGQCEDSNDRRFVFNYYNQTRRKMLAKLGSGTASHTYTTSTWRAYYNSTTVGTSRNEFVIGLDQLTRTDIIASYKLGYISFGYDSTSVELEADISAGDGTSVLNTHAYFGSKVLSDGYHYVQAMQYGNAGGVFHYMKMETHILC